MIRYDKPALKFEDQLKLLVSRGMEVSNFERARRVLANVSYFRLSGYWYPFREVDEKGQHTDTFRPGTRFEQVVELYEFDRQLRLAVLDAVERVEVGLRTAITYHFAHFAGAFGHTAAKHFNRRFEHTDWLQRVEQETDRSHETFVKHYLTHYEGHPRLPLWMATEVMSFGALSKLFQHVAADVQRKVAACFGVHHDVLVSWMHVIAVVRNICAHHGRLWNRELGVRPKLPARDRDWDVPAADRLFAVLLILRHMLRSLGEGDAWATDVERFVDPIASRGLNARSMGLPARWTEHPIWARRREPPREPLLS